VRVCLQVWGASADGAVHNPPHDIIWRAQPSWGAGCNAITKLLSKTGEVIKTGQVGMFIRGLRTGMDGVHEGSGCVPGN
jgi:hypothetical protein